MVDNINKSHLLAKCTNSGNSINSGQNTFFRNLLMQISPSPRPPGRLVDPAWGQQGPLPSAASQGLTEEEPGRSPLQFPPGSERGGAWSWEIFSGIWSTSNSFSVNTNDSWHMSFKPEIIKFQVQVLHPQFVFLQFLYLCWPPLRQKIKFSYLKMVRIIEK